jgi:ubiquinol-cytochrome c reductase cytochrome c1 subunit
MSMINLSSVARVAAGALALVAIAASTIATTSSPAAAAGEVIKYDRQSWSYAGFPLIGRGGYYNNNQLQRGFLVYKEVCSSCHGMKHIAFRNLVQPGGPEFPEAGVKSLAATYKIVDGPNDQGKMFKRAGLLSDRFPSPFSNEQEARSANNGALPPDLSIITKARGIDVERPFYMMPFAVLRDVFSGYQEAGSDYVYALLNGYIDAPLYKQEGTKMVALPPLKKGERKPAGALECASITKGEGGKADQCNAMQPGMNYNTHFAGHQIGMGAPLSDGQVTYTDGTAPTLANYSKDVVAFLAWSSDPNLESRKKAGVIAIAYLLLTALLMYFAKKRVWSRIGH